MSENPHQPLPVLHEKREVLCRKTSSSYAEKRRRNNEAARKSRKARKEQEIADAKKGISKEKKYKHIKPFLPSCSQEYRLTQKNNSP